ncbi:rhamnan synthesis F family protein [Arcticibacterium luteifluviistationis]|uniref:Uncharacterized protein n=1 Tax=Arcticibacterium luteifluviistationis TaxID=1784714 RepID=A0A2Z4GCC4_9BACT|nr:rhamnan synthesis F family protein [Arcticibacterium luteifluviistationis]AWV98794.1 hypothetical protein DJ013_11665 [Arcticibacterium luteifluviistationis]
MVQIENKLCVFIHYSERSCIPHNVQVYVNEIALHFDEVRVITNKRDIDEIASFQDNVRLYFEKNEGYDFGMFYKFAINRDLSKYSEIAIINDSNILIKELKEVFLKGRQKKADFWGLIASNQKPWFSTHENNYHIQSHFLVLNSAAIKGLSSFLESIDSKTIFDETNQKTLRRLVIDQWEIGFSQFLLKLGLEPFAYIPPNKNSTKNIAHTAPLEVINQGYPLLKKKVYYEAGSKSKKGWDNFLKETLPLNWRSELIQEELEKKRMSRKIPFLKRFFTS